MSVNWPPDPRFNAGEDPQGVLAYEPEYDDIRLTGQIRRVARAMVGKKIDGEWIDGEWSDGEWSDGEWRTLDEIAAITGDPQASISAQLRHLRKARFGNHTLEKRPRGDRHQGLWEYRVIWNKEVPRP